jgi:hypothetical protein
LTLAEDEHVIEALAAHAAQEPLTESVGLRRSYGRLQDSRAHTSRRPRLLKAIAHCQRHRPSVSP